MAELVSWKTVGQVGTGLGSNAANNIAIPAAARVDLVASLNTNNTLLVTTRSGQTLSMSINVRETVSLDGRIFAYFAAGTAFYWAIVPIDAAPTFPSSGVNAGGLSVVVSSGTITTLSAGKVTLQDDTAVSFQPYASGAVAPCDGVWHFTVKATTTTGITITDGTTSGVVAVPGSTVPTGVVTSGVVYTGVYVVAKGTTYTLTNASFLYGWIGPA